MAVRKRSNVLGFGQSRELDVNSFHSNLVDTKVAPVKTVHSKVYVLSRVNETLASERNDHAEFCKG